MEQEIKWEVGCYVDGSQWQITLNDKPIGMPIEYITEAKKLITWLANAGEDIATAVSRELEK